MRPKLKTGDLILVKNKDKSEYWGVYLKYESGAIHYRPAQGKNICYCKHRDILEAVSSTGEKLK
jgi:predicted NAD-dependent protein-ADP-ribosyltransferase YbiA (DUF1768 family)